MSYVVTIGGVDQTSKIDRAGFSIESVLTSEPDYARIKLINPTTAPQPNDEVEITRDSVVIFAGKVISSKIKSPSFKKVIHEVVAKDWTYSMDGKLVVGTYTEMTVDDIIADIKTNFMPSDITLTNVNCPIEVSVKFDYIPPSKAIQKLAELVGYDWYVDYDKDVHFFVPATETAPFSLTDSNNKYEWGTLEVNRDMSQIKNVVFVRGGEYLGDTYTEEKVADGNQVTFNLSYKYKNFEVWIDSGSGFVEQTVGIDFIDDADDFDCLHNFEMRTVKFPDASKPANGDIVRFIGDPYIPVMVRSDEESSKAEYGERQYKIVDKQIRTRQAAKDRAKAELQTYRQLMNEGVFYTYEDGLHVGQTITITSAERGIDEDFIINRIQATLLNDSTLSYRVNIVSKRSYDILALLQRLLDTSNIVEDKDEVLDKVNNIFEEVTIDEEVTVATNKSITETITISESIRTIEPIWVAGRYAPTSSLDMKRCPLLNGGAAVQS